MTAHCQTCTHHYIPCSLFKGHVIAHMPSGNVQHVNHATMSPCQWSHVPGCLPRGEPPYMPGRLCSAPFNVQVGALTRSLTPHGLTFIKNITECQFNITRGTHYVTNTRWDRNILNVRAAWVTPWHDISEDVCHRNGLFSVRAETVGALAQCGARTDALERGISPGARYKNWTVGHVCECRYCM